MTNKPEKWFQSVDGKDPKSLYAELDGAPKNMAEMVKDKLKAAANRMDFALTGTVDRQAKAAGGAELKDALAEGRRDLSEEKEKREVGTLAAFGKRNLSADEVNEFARTGELPQKKAVVEARPSWASRIGGGLASAAKAVWNAPAKALDVVTAAFKGTAKAETPAAMAAAAQARRGSHAQRAAALGLAVTMATAGCVLPPESETDEDEDADDKPVATATAAPSVEAKAPVPAATITPESPAPVAEVPKVASAPSVAKVGEPKIETRTASEITQAREALAAQEKAQQSLREEAGRLLSIQAYKGISDVAPGSSKREALTGKLRDSATAHGKTLSEKIKAAMGLYEAVEEFKAAIAAEQYPVLTQMSPGYEKTDAEANAIRFHAGEWLSSHAPVLRPSDHADVKNALRDLKQALDRSTMQADKNEKAKTQWKGRNPLETPALEADQAVWEVEQKLGAAQKAWSNYISGRALAASGSRGTVESQGNVTEAPAKKAPTPAVAPAPAPGKGGEVKTPTPTPTPTPAKVDPKAPKAGGKKGWLERAKEALGDVFKGGGEKAAAEKGQQNPELAPIDDVIFQARLLTGDLGEGGLYSRTIHDMNVHLHSDRKLPQPTALHAMAQGMLDEAEDLKAHPGQPEAATKLAHLKIRLKALEDAMRGPNGFGEKLQEKYRVLLYEQNKSGLEAAAFHFEQGERPHSRHRVSVTTSEGNSVSLGDYINMYKKFDTTMSVTRLQADAVMIRVLLAEAGSRYQGRSSVGMLAKELAKVESGTPNMKFVIAGKDGKVIAVTRGTDTSHLKTWVNGTADHDGTPTVEETGGGSAEIKKLAAQEKAVIDNTASLVSDGLLNSQGKSAIDALAHTHTGTAEKLVSQLRTIQQLLREMPKDPGYTEDRVSEAQVKSYINVGDPQDAIPAALQYLLRIRTSYSQHTGPMFQ